MTKLESEILEALAYFQATWTVDGKSEVCYAGKMVELAKFIAGYISKRYLVKKEG